MKYKSTINYNAGVLLKLEFLTEAMFCLKLFKLKAFGTAEERGSRFGAEEIRNRYQDDDRITETRSIPLKSLSDWLSQKFGMNFRLSDDQNF